MSAGLKVSGAALRRGILKFIEESPEGVSSKMVADRFSMSVRRASMYLGEYVRRGYPLRREPSDDGPRRFFYFYGRDTTGVTQLETAAPEAPKAPAAAHTSNPAESAYERISRAIDALSDAITDHVLDRVEQRIAERIAESIERSIPTSTLSTRKPRPPKVCIAGLIGSQHEIVRREFGDQFDLVFITADEHESVWKSKASKCEVTFLMADFVSHKHSAALSAAHVEPVVLHGAMSAIRDALTAYYLEKAT